MLINGDGSHCTQYSTRTGINLGYDMYFDSETILDQFERFFQLLPFKTEYKGYDFELIIDNARIHPTKEFSLQDSSKKIGTKYLVNSTEFADNDGLTKRLYCSFTSGD